MFRLSFGQSNTHYIILVDKINLIIETSNTTVSPGGQGNRVYFGFIMPTLTMAFASLQHIWSVLSQNLKEALDPNIESISSTSTLFVFKKIDIYAYRFCDSVCVILILCIKVDNSFIGELLQDVNKIRAVLYFLKALCVAPGLILENCLMMLKCERVSGYYSLNKRRLCWEASKPST